MADNKTENGTAIESQLDSPLKDSTIAPDFTLNPGREKSPVRQKCKATTKAGAPCKLNAMKDSDFCFWHGDPEVVKAAARLGYERGLLNRSKDRPRLKPIRSVNDFEREVRLICDDVLRGRITQGQAGKALEGLRAIMDAFISARIVSEIEETKRLLQEHESGSGGKLLELVDRFQSRKGGGDNAGD